MKTRIGLCLLVLSAAAFQTPPTSRRHLPPPLRLHVPFETVWKAARQALVEREEEFYVEDQARGRLATEYREFSSGPLTESHIAKIGERPKLIDGEWVRVEYQLDVGLTLIDDKQTILTADANVRALSREFLGGQKWVSIPSNGRLESELLTEIGRSLFGQNFSLAQPRKGFWEREPGYLPDADLGPQVVGPERKRP